MPRIGIAGTHTHASDAQGGQVSHDSALTGVSALDHHAAAILEGLVTTVGDMIRRGASGPMRMGAGSNDEVLTIVGGVPAWAAGGGGGLGALTAHRRGDSDRWAPTLGMMPSGTKTVTFDEFYAYPVHVGQQQTMDEILIDVTAGGGGGNTRMGIYADDGNSYPGALTLDAGEVASNTTGIKAISISESLAPGLHWLVILFSATPTVRGLASNALMNTVLGLTDFAGATHAYGWLGTQAYGALPATFPAGATKITEGSSAGVFCSWAA